MRVLIAWHEFHIFCLTLTFVGRLISLGQQKHAARNQEAFLMSVSATSLPRELARHLGTVDFSRVRADQGWVLNVMRQDGAAIVRLLWRMLGREQDVLDAYQECFCRLLAYEKTAEEGPPPRGYVF